MKIAILNLCHTDPGITARAAEKLTQHESIDMYLHVDLKSDIEPFITALSGIPRVYFIKDRVKLYWGGFNAIKATIALLRQSLASSVHYDYFVIFQNFDYPLRTNDQIISFFKESAGKEFIRGCRMARTHDWHFAMKYRIYNDRDNDFYLTKHSKPRMYMRYVHMLLRSIGTIFFNGVIRESGQSYELYYGAAQWAVTRELAEYFIEFYDTHQKFNKIMAHIQFPDESYFHTITHNTRFKHNCIKYDEPVMRWLVNWRNLHYFEYPDEITVMCESDFEKLMAEDALFVRKVRTGVSEGLLDKIDSRG